MEIFDISQEIFTCSIFPGDNAPERKVVQSILSGDICNLTEFSMCAHNGTHIDAPYHFCQNGKTVDILPLETFVGKCYVGTLQGEVTQKAAEQLMEKAKAADSQAAKRILIRGDAFVSLEAARVFKKEQILLLGNESQTVGPLQAPAAVHCELLGAGMVLLEGIRLSAVMDGIYLLNAVPLNLGGSDGSPCRAILMSI